MIFVRRAGFNYQEGLRVLRREVWVYSRMGVNPTNESFRLTESKHSFVCIWPRDIHDGHSGDGLE